MTACNFEHLIGQPEIKKRLNHYIECFDKTRKIPFLLFDAAKGMGKTEFSRTLCDALKTEDDNPRTSIEINCSTLKKVEDFYQMVYLQQGVHQGNEVNLFFDEAHNIGGPVEQMMLTLLGGSGTENIQRVMTSDGEEMVFDFRRVAIMLATTDADKLFEPLKDRLDSLDFKPYSYPELQEIVKRCCDSVVFGPNVLEEIGLTLRGNPRSAVKRANQINNYCSLKEITVFGEDQWLDLIDIHSVQPYGLNNNEVLVLQTLKDNGKCSLTDLCAVTGMSRSAISRNVEMHLRKNMLIKNGAASKREITPAGIEVLANLN